MGQEDTENKISLESLRSMVDEAIKNKNICIIDKVEHENLRYAQKYAESLISKNESNISSKSYFMGINSIVLAFLAIGLSYFLAGISRYQLENVNVYSGLSIIIFGAVLFLWIKLKKENEIANINKNIEFIHEIILKIEEKLSSRT